MCKIEIKNKGISKISIVGGPGSGKTTLAKKLSIILNIPKYHIDGIHHLENWKERDKEERDKIILDIVNKDKWIIDGTYKSTLEERIKRSDLVIFLDYSTLARIKGILKRIILNFNKEKEEIPGCKEKADFKFIKYSLFYNKKYRNRITDVLDKYKGEKILIFRNRKSLNVWLEDLIKKNDFRIKIKK